MGYGTYWANGRLCGYMVDAECDQPGCTAEIDRGLGWLCGSDPWAEDGCHDYFCSEHMATHDCPAETDSEGS